MPSAPPIEKSYMFWEQIFLYVLVCTCFIQPAIELICCSQVSPKPYRETYIYIVSEQRLVQTATQDSHMFILYMVVAPIRSPENTWFCYMSPYEDRNFVVLQKFVVVTRFCSQPLYWVMYNTSIIYIAYILSAMRTLFSSMLREDMPLYIQIPSVLHIMTIWEHIIRSYYYSS